jgi:nucleoside-diphosphate-sugar epimerase
MDNKAILNEDIRKVVRTEHIEYFRNKSILITGASGLIGTYFSAFFEYLNAIYMCNIELFLSSYSGEFSSLELSPKTNIIIGDLNSIETLSRFPKFDVIIHAAGYGQPGKFLRDYQNTMKLNSCATIELTKKLNPNGTMLFISSSEVYSGLSEPPFKESEIGSSNTSHDRSSYIEGKRFGEAVLANESMRNPLGRYHSIRLALAYGPGIKVSDERVINTFVKDALLNGEINLQDPGLAWRTYCYIADALDMCLTVLLKGAEPVYNIGGISRVQIIELAREIALQTNAKVHAPISGDQFKVGAPNDVWLDLTLINEIRKSNNFVTLSDGISKLISWTRNILHS